MNDPRIGATLIVLRAPRLSDAPALADMMTPAVSRWLGSWPVPFTPALAAERIAAVSRAEVGGLGLFRVIERQNDAAVLGWVGVSKPSSDARRAVLSYLLGEAHHGRRVMREAAPAMVALAFRAWNVDTVEASTHPENLASAAVLRSCGMQHIGERTIFAPTRKHDELCFIFEVHRSAGDDDGSVNR